jgi:L-fucose dehydrogenase
LDLGLKNKIVVVIGGARGVGAAIVRACAAEDAIPVIVDRDVDGGRALLAEVRQGNAQCGLFPVDLIVADNSAKVIAQTIAEFGRIDALVNSTAPGYDVGLERGSSGEYFEMLKLKLVPCYSVVIYAVPHLKQSRGSIVNVSSSPEVNRSGSWTSAVMALTREWAAELLPFGVRVNMVLAESMGRREIDQPLGESADNIAAAVAFLLSTKSSHTTGQHIYADRSYDRASCAQS